MCYLMMLEVIAVTWEWWWLTLDMVIVKFRHTWVCADQEAYRHKFNSWIYESLTLVPNKDDEEQIATRMIQIIAIWEWFK